MPNFSSTPSQDHRARGRRLDVRVGQPGVEREQRHLDAKASANAAKHTDCAFGGRTTVQELVVVEGPVPAASWCWTYDVEDRDDHQQRADHRVDDELDRRVEPPLAAPDADDEVHRDQHHLPEDVEEEQVERDERAEHAGLEDEHRDDELARPSCRSSSTPSSMIGMRNVVSMTSHSEMPSMPSLKCMPRPGPTRASTTSSSCAGCEVADRAATSETKNVSSEIVKPSRGWRPSLRLAACSSTRSAPRSGRKRDGVAGGITVTSTVRVRDEASLQRGSMRVDGDLRASPACRSGARSRRDLAAVGAVTGAVVVPVDACTAGAWPCGPAPWALTSTSRPLTAVLELAAAGQRPVAYRRTRCGGADDDADDVALHVAVLRSADSAAEEADDEAPTPLTSEQIDDEASTTFHRTQRDRRNGRTMRKS